MAYGKCNDLSKKAESDRVLQEKDFTIASDPKYDGYERGLASMVCKFSDNKSASLAEKSAKGSGIKSMSNRNLQIKFINQLLENLK